jgi:hypothetical protein
MEMIDVLNKLQEIADKSPEVAKAIESVKQTNPKEVSENAVESEAPTNKEPVKEYEDKIQEYKVGTFKDFLASKGRDIYKLKSDEYSKYAQEYKAEREKAQQDATAHKGTDDHRELTRIAKYDDVDPTTTEGGMSDVHIGAQEVIDEYMDDSGNLAQPKKETLQLMALEKLKAPFPKSYEIETAMQMVQNDFDNSGGRRHEIDEPEGIDGLGDSEQLNTTTMKTEDKKQVNEAIQISTDSPEEAGVMMQILKLAGVKPVDDAMINAEPDAEVNPEHGDEGHDHSDCPVCGDDAVGSNEMGQMRNMISQNDGGEQAEETFANEPDEKVSDVDTLVNVHSGGLNKQKQQVRKEYPGDNPLAVKEDTITEQDLAESFRAQYEGFKKSYQEAAKVTEKKAKPDFLDMDKDGDKKEPMKKAIADKK